MLFILLAKIMAIIFDFNESERLGREKDLYQGDEQQWKKGWGKGVEWMSRPFQPPPGTLDSTSKSNIAGGINDRALLDFNSPY